MNTPIVIKQNSKGNFLYVLGALVLCVLSFIFLLMDFSTLANSSNIFSLFFQIPFFYVVLKIILCIGVVFFGYGFVYLLKRMKQGKNILIVDENGITDNSSAISFGFIPWEDINDIKIVSMLNNDLIELSLNNEQEYIDKLPSLKRHMIAANKKLGYNAACITLNSTGISPYSLLPDIQTKFFDSKRIL